MTDSLVPRQDGPAPPISPASIASLVMLISGGQVFFPLMLFVIFLFRNVYSKSWIFLNWCFVWIIYSISFTLLLYANRVTGPLPSFDLCFLQALLVYMTPVLSSSALLVFVYHFWSSVSFALKQQSRRPPWVYKMMIAGPYVISLVPAIIATVAVSKDPGLVEREAGDFYCSIDFHPLRMIVALVTGFFILASLILEGFIARILYQHRLALKQVRVQGWGLADLFGRICCFMIAAITGLVMAMVATFDPDNQSRIVFQAFLPLLAFLLFGTRPDFYKRDRSASSGDAKLTSESKLTLV